MTMLKLQSEITDILILSPKLLKFLQGVKAQLRSSLPVLKKVPWVTGLETSRMKVIGPYCILIVSTSP